MVLAPKRKVPELVEFVMIVSVKTTLPLVGEPAPKPGRALIVAVAAQFAPYAEFELPLTFADDKAIVV